MTETLLRSGTKTIRPLRAQLGLTAWSYSQHLQRLMVDFGAEGSFESSSKRLKLHHQISVSSSSIRKITLRHAKIIQEQQKPQGTHGKLKSKGASRIITEMDGSMIPMVECSPGKGKDSRKNRNCHWKEGRLCAARVQGESSTRYGVSFGSVEQAGFTWAATVAKLDWAVTTDLHVVGDGASWIAQQLSFCGLKCTTFLRFKVYHPESLSLFIWHRRFVERDL